MEKNIKRDSWRAAIVAEVAEMHGVTKRQVYRVINGERDNDKVMASYMTLLENKNELLNSVRKIVQFN